MKHMIAALLVLTMLLGLGTVGIAEEKKLDTIRILGPAPDFTVENVTYRLFEDMIEGDSEIWKALEALFANNGLKLELDLIPNDQYATVLQTRIAAGLDCDIVSFAFYDSAARLRLVERGMFQPINKIIEEYCNDKTKAFFKEDLGAIMPQRLTQEDGNFYWFADAERGYYGATDHPAGATQAFLIRYDWMEALGAEIPVTTDELFDLLVAFQENDMNGNGEKDEVISVSLDNFATGIAAWFGIGPEITFISQDLTTIETPWKSPNMKAYIEFMQRLTAAGLLDTSDQAGQKRVENKLSGEWNWGPESWLEPQIVVQEGAKTAQYVPILCKAVDNVEPSVLIQNGDSLNPYGYGVTQHCENPEIIGRLLDCVCSDEYFMLTKYGVEGYTYTVEADGTITKMEGDELDKKLYRTAWGIWAGSFLPRYDYNDRSAEIDKNCIVGAQYADYPNGWTKKNEALRSLVENKQHMMHETGSNLTAATPEEQKRLDKITTDLSTYSSELLMNLILGEQSMENWDAYIADLERLGLDEYVAINQVRLDRVNTVK